MLALKIDEEDDDSPIPHGMGGLKCGALPPESGLFKSHPTRDGWIEIYVTPNHPAGPWSHPTRDGWIEIRCKEA